MSDTSIGHKDLAGAIRRYQRRSVFATITVTIVLVLAIAVFLLYSLRAIDHARAKLTELSTAVTQKSRELEQKNTELEQLKAQISDLQHKLQESALYVRHVYNLDWRNMKLILSQFGHAGRALEIIGGLRDQNAHWGLANTLQEGFTSPGFAAYVLARSGAQSADLSTLSARSGPPHPGDLIFYESGYAMFFFRDNPRTGPVDFVVGMTPYGIASLERDFGVAQQSVRVTPFSE